MTSTRTFLFSSLVLSAALLGACGGDDDTAGESSAAPETEDTSTSETAGESSEPAQEAAGDDVVIMEESRFVPDTLEVPAGTEVTFENTDPFAHTVTSAEGSPLEFDSGELAEDETFSQTFDEAGTYEYFCQIHPTMQAEVVVS